MEANTSPKLPIKPKRVAKRSNMVDQCCPTSRNGRIAVGVLLFVVVASFFFEMPITVEDEPALATEYPELFCATQSQDPTKCNVNILTAAPNETTYCQAWNNLGVQLQLGGSIFVRGRRRTQKELFHLAIKCNPAYSQAWFNAANAAEDENDSITVDGTVYNKEAMFVKCLELDPKSQADAWNYLAATRTGERPGIEIAGVEMNVVELLQGALEADKENPHVWKNIVMLLQTQTDEHAALTFEGKPYKLKDAQKQYKKVAKKAGVI